MGLDPRGVFAGPWHGAVSAAVLVLLLLAVCVSDVRSRRIPNWLVLVILAFGLANAVALAGTSGVARAAVSVGIGLVLWLPLHFLRMMGAGDVKFFAATCAWLDPTTALRAALLSAIFGGVLALIWVAGAAGARQRALRAVAAPASGTAAEATTLRPDSRWRRLPYGLAMAAGLAAAVWLPTSFL